MKSIKISFMKCVKNPELCRIKLNCNKIEGEKNDAICDLFDRFD